MYKGWDSFNYFLFIAPFSNHSSSRHICSTPNNTQKIIAYPQTFYAGTFFYSYVSEENKKKPTSYGMSEAW